LDWKEAPVDAMLLRLQRLAEFHLAEIRRDYDGLGNYERLHGLEAPVAYTDPDVGLAVDPSTIVDAVECNCEIQLLPMKSVKVTQDENEAPHQHTVSAAISQHTAPTYRYNPGIKGN